MLERLARWRELRRQNAAKERTLARDGFIAYCECRAILNDSPCESRDDGTWIYTCACGFKSRFVFGLPAPVRIQAWDPAGVELAGGSGGALGGGVSTPTSR